MSDDQSTSSESWPQPDSSQPAQAPTPPPTSASAPNNVPGAPGVPPTEPKKKKPSLKVLASAAVAVILFVALVMVFTGSSGGGKSAESIWVAYEYRNDDKYDIFLASVKDGDVVTGTRINDDNYVGITYYSSIDSKTPNWVPFVKDGDTLFTWGEDGDDEELTALNTKDDTKTSVFRGSDIQQVRYIADEKVFLVSDDGSCFAATKDNPSTRLGYGSCIIEGGKVFTSKADNEEVTINESDLDGSSKNRQTFPLVGEWAIRNNGRVITGFTAAGVFEVYDLSSGKRLLTTKETDKVTILSESEDSSNLLLAVEDPELVDETLDVGVMVVADGVGSWVKFSSPARVSGYLSPKGDEFVLITAKSLEANSFSISNNKLSDKSSNEITEADSIEETWSDDHGRIAIVTDSEVVSGDFEDGFKASINGSFEDGDFYIYSSPNSDGILVKSINGSKSDLYFVKDGKSDARTKPYVTLTTGASSISVDETSMNIDGSVVYSETNNNYVEIFKQELKKDSKRTKVAEGRYEGYQVDPSGEFYYYEKDDNSVTTYQQKGDKAKDRKTLSTRYLYTRVDISENQNALSIGSYFKESAEAIVDRDVQNCRAAGLPTLTSDESQSFTLTRSSRYSPYSADKKMFCVTTTGESTARVDSFTANDGTTSMRIALDCSDNDTSFSQDETYLNTSDSTYRTDISFPSTPGTYTCTVWDDYDYSYYSGAMGGQVTIALG
jgi:hypothetical protein